MHKDDRVDATTILYSSPSLSSSLLAQFGIARTKVYRPLTRGLTSHVYRLQVKIGVAKDDKEDNECSDASQYCLKRVCEDDEMPPHSIRREMMCYRIINDEKKKVKNENVPIITLLAAFRDESDPFSIEVDLIMPLYPCTLEELMDEPLLQLTIDADAVRSASTTGQRPALILAQRIHASTFQSFIQSTTSAFFSALAFLHEHGIAHRDIKPSNILVDSKTLSIVLIDFGTCHLPSYKEGDDGIGGITSEVGTGAYRAPESLFSPLKGYDVFKLDIWQAGTTLIQFFLPLRKVELSKKKEEQFREECVDSKDSEDEDNRQEWEKALWADDEGISWSKLEEVWNADRSKALEGYSLANDDKAAGDTKSGWKRETLFDATNSDIGLANGMFELLGLPSDKQAWPEAEYFQPSLDKMPFARRPASAGGLQERIASNNVIIPPSLEPLLGILDRCMQLSSSRRISANEALSLLQHQTSRT
ncbi:hypothetical protein CBS101457_005456 [Exobasidium rhododendri]|nr:hypothetical protein CBS101457_005456 [Exobasidium rhododendri]